MVPFTLTTKNVYNGALYSHDHDQLYPQLRGWASNRAQCAFNFSQFADTPNEGSVMNNIIKIACSNFKAVRKPIQHIEAKYLV